ncbi:MAG TPA: SAM-dependent methyltransferase [Planctomycetes bacterium]|nr:SAM-dependent methyltransferase [Planctomycetota bacterium]
MNRERELEGGNSYSRDLGLSVGELLAQRLERGHAVRWLDLCCGSGRALIQAAERFRNQELEILGVDLVDFFAPRPAGLLGLRFAVASLREWEPAESDFDLVTCVHGLHYVGDKLGLIARACSWLAEDGLLVANLDLAQVVLREGSAARRVSQVLRAQGLHYDRRKHLLRCEGRREIELPFTYLGADDQAGPNYTGQPAVASHYEIR